MTQSDEPPGLTRLGRVLVAEDDEAMLDLVVGWLHEAGYDVTACSCGIDLRAQLERSVLSEELPEFDVVVSDIRMPSGTALDVLDDFYRCDGVPPMILMTAFATSRTREAAGDLGVATVLEKPFGKGRLLAAIERALARAADAANSPALASQP